MYQSSLYFILFILLLVKGSDAQQVRPPPIVTHQIITQPFATITVQGVNLGGPGSNVTAFFGSSKTACKSINMDITYLRDNTTFICNAPSIDPKFQNQLTAMDVTITVDGVTHVSKWMFIYTQSAQSCVFSGPNSVKFCADPNVCTYGICECKSASVGPLCNLDQTFSTYARDKNMPKFRYIYQNGFLEWDIVFNKLNIWDNDTNSFVLFRDLTTNLVWTVYTIGLESVVYTSSAIDPAYSNSYIKITMKFPSEMTTYNINDYAFYVQPNSMIYKAEIGGLPNSEITQYQLGFKIDTNYTNTCDTQKIQYFNFEYNKNNQDNRWFIFTKNSVSIYCRYSSRCQQDNQTIAQYCPLNMIGDPIQQNLGNGQFFITYQTFAINSESIFDFLIVNYTDFPVYEAPVCKENVPDSTPAHWLLPSIVPLASLCLASFLLVIMLIFKENKKTLQYGILVEETPLINISVEKEVKNEFDLQ